MAFTIILRLLIVLILIALICIVGLVVPSGITRLILECWRHWPHGINPVAPQCIHHQLPERIPQRLTNPLEPQPYQIVGWKFCNKNTLVLAERHRAFKIPVVVAVSGILLIRIVLMLVLIVLLAAPLVILLRRRLLVLLLLSLVIVIKQRVHSGFPFLLGLFVIERIEWVIVWIR